MGISVSDAFAGADIRAELLAHRGKLSRVFDDSYLRLSMLDCINGHRILENFSLLSNR